MIVPLQFTHTPTLHYLNETVMKFYSIVGAFIKGYTTNSKDKTVGFVLIWTNQIIFMIQIF
jgi:hypothetical protein